MNENTDNSYSWNVVFETRDFIDNNYMKIMLVYHILWFHCERYDFLLSFRVWANANTKKLLQLRCGAVGRASE